MTELVESILVATLLVCGFMLCIHWDEQDKK